MAATRFQVVSSLLRSAQSSYLLDVLPALFAVLAFEVACHGEVSVDFDAVHTLYGRTQEAEKAGMAVTRFCSLVERRGVNRHAWSGFRDVPCRPRAVSFGLGCNRPVSFGLK